MKLTPCHLIAALALLGFGATSLAADKVTGNPDLAKPIVQEQCAACHGEDGNSPVPNFPNLAGQVIESIFAELKAFKAEHRQSETMPAAIVANLTDADLANLALYFAAQIPKPATVTKPELLDLGKKLYLNGNPDSGVPSCDGCHEEDGHGSPPRFPRLAGQNVEYTIDEFRQYAANQRQNGIKQMRTIAQRLTAKEIEALAQYIASMK